MDPLGETFQQTHDIAMQQQQGRFAADKNLLVSFHNSSMLDVDASQKEGRPIHRSVEHVKIYIPGSREVTDKVVTGLERSRFKDLYDKWKANEEINLSGTPLESCTWVDRALVEEMKFFHIRTVEQLAGLSDTHAQKFPGITRYRDLAKAYIAQAEKGKAAAELASAMDAQKKENADLREMIQGLQATVAKLSGVESPSAPPKPRARRASA